ncbi:MAG TPA: hypothetical protein VME23_06350 [Terracidiphilus sp.]|nr:hypothetical protein [Terracidiphilus sp.]
MKPDAQTTKNEAPPASLGRPKVVTDFTAGYLPPFDVAAKIEKMLDPIPLKYLNGLSEIVLTNTAGLPRKLRRSVTKSRKRKVRAAEALGLYYQKWKGRPAWIKIYVDNTLRNWESGIWLKLGFFREMLLGDVLFHEIGHHIHKTVRPEFREREDVADDWKTKLRRHQFAAQHPLQRAVFGVFMPLIRKYSRRFDSNGRRRQ